MRDIHGHTLFCDDIRSELGNKFSYMGVYGDDINLAGELPTLLPKLCMISTIYVPSGTPIGKLQLTISQRNESEIRIIVDQHIEVAEKNIPKKPGDGFAKLVLQNIISPINIPSNCEILVSAKVGDMELDIGSLTVTAHNAPALPASKK